MGATILDKRMKFGYFLLVGIVFIIIAIRNALVPFCHDEVATFVMYVQDGKFWPYHAIVDANNHFLNSGLSHICFKLFGPSTFSLRLPNLGAFVLLAFFVYRLLFHLKTNTARLSLIALFLISFNWLSFYSTCRGYGISMSLLIGSLLLMLEYFKSGKRWQFYGFLLVIQLAISANLTILILSLMLTVIVLFYQIVQQKIKDIWLVPGYLMHFVSLYLWVGFSFFLKEGNALYYGQGDNYWDITFVTLIELITGWINLNFDFIVAILVVVIFVTIIFTIRKEWWTRMKNLDPLIIFTGLFLGAFVSFYILHHWKDVNYPEDRTGLFFYPLFVMMLVFFIDSISIEKTRKYFLMIPVLMILHFGLSMNFKNHVINEYETFPESFYTTLEDEQEKSKDKISISGHRLNELLYAFFNYQGGGNLNLVDGSEELNLFGDYAIIKTSEKSRYEKYYDVIDTYDWDFVLLKRKKKCERILIHEIKSEEWKEVTDEFSEYFRVSDTLVADTSPLLVEFNFDIDHASQPFNGWLVVEVKDENDQRNYYKRIPLNWIRFSWNHTENNRFDLLTGELPQNMKSMVVYLWNHKKQFIRIKMNSVKFFSLH